MISKGLFSSDSNEWETPQTLFNQLDKEYNFTLDPCSTSDNAKCKKFYTKEDDGLSKDWGGESVFVNPPYGREIKHWVEKSYKESLKPNTKVVMLIPARTDTKYWHEWIFGEAEIVFLKGRIKFEQGGVAKNTAPFPSALVIYNNRQIKEKQL